MGNYLTTCNGIKSVSIIKSTKNDLPLNNKITIKLVLVGLDNSGKTSTALHLLKKPLNDIVPTLGYNSYTLDSLPFSKNKDAKIELVDLGGSVKIRKIWEEYYSSAHGLICLLDSADHERFKEIKVELEKLLSNKNVQGKPLLVLLNKMDLDEAMDEVEICNEINIEHLVNEYKCPTKIEQCAVHNKSKDANQTEKKKKINLDTGIEQGFNWIVNYILNNWETLNERVKIEIEKEEKRSKEKMDALREKYKDKKEEIIEETEEDIKENPFKPIDEVVKNLDKKETKNSLKMKNEVNKNELNKIETIKNETIKNEINKNEINKNDSIKKTEKIKSKSIEKFAEKINEVKKKAMVIKQNKVHEKDKTQINNGKNTIEDKESKELKEVIKESTNEPIKESNEEISRNSTGTNSIDTISNDTVIEIKK